MSLHHRLRGVRSLALIAGAAFASSCGSSNPAESGSGAIALSLAPAAATVAQGASAGVLGTVTRSGGFAGDVAITITGVPTGVTGTVVSSPTNGGNTAQMTIAVASTVTAGTYTLTITATGSGVTTVSKSFTLTVSTTTAVGGVFTATLDGQPWNGNALQSAAYSNQVLNLSGWNGTSYITFTVLQPTTMTAIDLGYINATGSSAIVTDVGGAGWNTTGVGGTGSITITLLTSNHVTGSFFFTAVPSKGSSGTGTRVASNGTFDLTY